MSGEDESACFFFAASTAPSSSLPIRSFSSSDSAGGEGGLADRGRLPFSCLPVKTDISVVCLNGGVEEAVGVATGVALAVLRGSWRRCGCC